MERIEILVSGVITALMTGNDFTLAGNVNAIDIDLGHDLQEEALHRNTVLDIVVSD